MIRHSRRAAGIALVALGTVAAESRAQEKGGHDLGTVVFPVSCSAQAQAKFTHAVALLHHMTYPAAREEFRSVLVIDPKCAMAHWGVAMTLFQPLWPTRPGPAALATGWEAVERARALKPPTERERLFVESMAEFYKEPASTDYWLRVRRWERATEAQYAAFPDDHEVAVFRALALLAVAPTDSSPPSVYARAAEIVLHVYEQNPDHPGAMHYLVHANDAPGRERDSLSITRKYEAIAPRNPHALHMPTHIYTRLGDWDAVIEGNLKAAQAALEQPAGERGEFVWDEFPHAIEYLVYAQLQKGADREAAAQLARLLGTANIEPTFKAAFHSASTQARSVLERRAWNEAVRLRPREPAALDWDRFPWPEAITHFARGLGAVHLGDSAAAKASSARLDQLEAASDKTGEVLFTTNIRILRLTLDAWRSFLAGDSAASVSRMREAAELEIATPKAPVTPAPTLPAPELLGDLLMELKRPAEAFSAYSRSLALYPRRLNGLLGAARAAWAMGDVERARSIYRAVHLLAQEGDRQAVLDEARQIILRP